MIKSGFVIFLFFLVLPCFSQSNFGIQIEMGYVTLTNISTEELRPYGYSGADFTVKDRFAVSPSLRLRKSLSDRESLEVGIGYLAQNHEIGLKYHYWFFQTYVDTTLEINLKYLILPIAYHYSIPITSKTNLLLSTALNTKVLITQEDNFESIIYEEIGFVTRNWYNRIVFAPALSVDYQIKLNGGGMTELGLFVSIDFTRFVKNEEKVWGFMKI